MVLTKLFHFLIHSKHFAYIADHHIQADQNEPVWNCLRPIWPTHTSISTNRFLVWPLDFCSAITVSFLSISDCSTFGNAFKTSSISNRLYNPSLIPFHFELLRIVNVVIVSLTVKEAWKARHLSTEFQENESILRTILVLSIGASICFPVLWLSNDIQINTYVLTSFLFIMVRLSVTTPLCFTVQKYLNLLLILLLLR